MKKTTVLILALSLALTSCFPESADEIEKQQTKKMAKDAAMKVGPPNIVNFTEKRFAKLIYELRDKEVKTYSYFMDMHGKLHFLCESVGFGVPASVQYVNPQRYHHNGATLSQPEPNALFMPDSLSATYVLCSGKNGKLQPVYSEPALIVSPFPLNNSGSLKK